MLDIFDFNDVINEYGHNDLSSEDFITKTKTLLREMSELYGDCNKSRYVTTEEFELGDCDNCQGQCTIKLNDGEEISCMAIDGDCVVSFFDEEEFADKMEDIMFEKETFYELMLCDIKKKNYGKE